MKRWDKLSSSTDKFDISGKFCDHASQIRIQFLKSSRRSAMSKGRDDFSEDERVFRASFQRYGPTSSVTRLDEDGVREILFGYIDRRDINAIASLQAGVEPSAFSPGCRITSRATSTFYFLIPTHLSR